jgi:hypothetical protein
MGSSKINIPSVSYVEDHNDSLPVINFVDNAALTYPGCATLAVPPA